MGRPPSGDRTGGASSFETVNSHFESPNCGATGSSSSCLKPLPRISIDWHSVLDRGALFIILRFACAWCVFGPMVVSADLSMLSLLCACWLSVLILPLLIVSADCLFCFVPVALPLFSLLLCFCYMSLLLTPPPPSLLETSIKLGHYRNHLAFGGILLVWVFRRSQETPDFRVWISPTDGSLV